MRNYPEIKMKKSKAQYKIYKSGEYLGMVFCVAQGIWDHSENEGVHLSLTRREAIIRLIHNQ